jgi:hypothetical protein
VPLRQQSSRERLGSMPESPHRRSALWRHGQDQNQVLMHDLNGLSA